MPGSAEQLDANYRAVPSIVSPGNGLVVQQAGPTVVTDPVSNLSYAPGVTSLSQSINNGLPLTQPSPIQKAKAASTGNVASLGATFASNNAANNTIVVQIGNGNNGTLSVTDSAGNTYQKAISQANSTTFEAAIWFATPTVATTTPNTVTVANAGSAASMAMEIYEVPGILQLAVAQPDQSTSGTGTSATPTLSALAPSVPNSIMFLGIAVGTAAEAVSVTAATNWTLDSTQNTTTPSGLYTFGALSQYLPGLTPVIPTATVASSEPYAAVAAIFKPVAVPIGGTVQIGGLNYTNITGTATTLVKTGSGVLHRIVVNTIPASGGTLEIDDALTNTTPKVGTITSPTVVGAIPYGIEFSTGLSITTATHAGDYTIVWE
jgi:hypothetical protein